MRRKHLLAVALVAALLHLSPQLHALTYAGDADNLAYDTMHIAGITGSGAIIGVIDTGYARTDHSTFYTSETDTTSRVTKLLYYNGSLTYTGHANGVAGVAAGRGDGEGGYVGVAPGAEVWSASTSGEDNDMRQAYLDMSTPDGEGKRCKIFAVSLASPTADHGLYSIDAFVDWMATERGALVCLGSGNSPDYIAVPGGSYNVLTVGGVTAELNAVTDSSGRGPTLDGRSKPDVVAPSSKLLVPDHVGVDAWYRNPGSYTSASQPFAPGTAALLHQVVEEHGMTWDARVAKVNIMNSATKLAGWTHSNTQPLDNAQGAGMINCEWAVYQTLAGEQSPGDVIGRGWDLATVTGSVSNTYHITNTAKSEFYIAATLNWYRYLSVTDDNLLGHNWHIDKFENLNLYLYRESDCALVAQSTSAIDSVEHIFFHVDQTDTYALTVDLVGPGSRSDNYALAWFTLIPGDANGDGIVDGADLAVWQRHYDPLGLSLPTWVKGDWNFDNIVDGADLALWQQNYNPLGYYEDGDLGDFPTMGETLQSLGVVPGVVPEPATATMLALAASGLACMRRRRRAKR